MAVGEPVNVALLGTGALGAAMARPLTRSAVSLTLWNRSRDRATRLAQEIGARVADSPADAVADADVVLTALSDRTAVEAVYLGPGGVLEGARAGLIVCEMSTVEPSISVHLAEALAVVGAHVLDAPVSGSVSLAEQGSLTLMVGGDPQVLDQARGVLGLLGSRIFHMGPVGRGAAMKLAVNSVLHGLNQALSEALVLAEHADINRELAYDVLQNSAAAAPFVHYKRDSFLDPAHAPVMSRLALARKDMQLVLELARSLSVTMAQGEANLAVLDAAAEQYGSRDMSALAEYMSGLAGDRAPGLSSTDATDV